MGVLMKRGINYTGSGDILNQPVIYSDSERCIGVWRDGKPLYQKSFNVNVNNSSASGFTQVVTENEFGVPYSSIEKFIDVKAQVGKVVIPRIRIKSSWSENVYTSDGKINIEAAHEVTNETWNITVQYTKTTD